MTTPVEITDRAYSVETPQSDEASHATPVTRTLQRSGDAITFGAPAAVNGTTQAGLGAVFGSGPTTVPKASAIQGGIGLGGLLIALAIWRFYRRNPEWQDLKQSYDKARYGEWISLGTVPDGDEYEKVAISGLTDLLDIAIDSNKRIIHDADRALYAVVDNGIVYEYNEALDELDSPEHRYIDVSGEEVPQLGSAGQESFFDQVTDDKTGDSIWDSLDEAADAGDGPVDQQPAPDLMAAEETADSQTDSPPRDADSDLPAGDEDDSSRWETFGDAIDSEGELREQQAVLDPAVEDDAAGKPADD